MKEGAFQVGAASVDLTPGDFVPGVYLAGFDPNRKAAGVLDPLECQAMVVRGSEGPSLAWATADLIGILHPDVCRIRALVSGADMQTLVCATHTHSGPDTIGLWGFAPVRGVVARSGVDRRCVAMVRARIAQALRQARNGLRPATMVAAQFSLPAELLRNERKGGTKDDHGVALGFLRGDQFLATVVFVGAHPETLWESNRLVSSDFPGHLRQRLRELGHRSPMFVPAALGAMVTPNVPLEAGLFERMQYARTLGRKIAELADEALRSDRAIRASRARIRHFARKVELPVANWRFVLAKVLRIIDRPLHQGRVCTEVHLALFGEVLTVVGLPGEPSPELAREALACVGGRLKAVAALCCDELGYLLTQSQWRDPEYSYERTMSLGHRTGPSLLRIVEGLWGMSTR